MLLLLSDNQKGLDFKYYVYYKIKVKSDSKYLKKEF